LAPLSSYVIKGIMKLIEIEKEYVEAYKSQSTLMASIFNKSKKIAPIDLNSTEITQCLLKRLTAYYETQDQIKTFLNKRYAAPAADFFVESVVYFLKLLIETTGTELEVHSERQIRKKKNAIRPDISIWKNNKVVAIIECKTQLGWNRSTWEKDFIKRGKILKQSFPNACAYLLVMTGRNWGGFTEEKLANGKYFCILKDKWPIELDSHTVSEEILTPVESLLKKIL